MTTPGHIHVTRVAEQARAWHAARMAAAHAVTVTTGRYAADAHLLRVTAACACAEWKAEGVVNPAAPAYDNGAMPTRLRTLHRDHLANIALAAQAAARAELSA